MYQHKLRFSAVYAFEDEGSDPKWRNSKMLESRAFEPWAPPGHLLTVTQSSTPSTLILRTPVGGT